MINREMDGGWDIKHHPNPDDQSYALVMSKLLPPQGAASHGPLIINNWVAGVASKHWTRGKVRHEDSALLLLVARWSQCTECTVRMIWVCHVQWGDTEQLCSSFCKHTLLQLLLIWSFTVCADSYFVCRHFYKVKERRESETGWRETFTFSLR